MKHKKHRSGAIAVPSASVVTEHKSMREWLYHCGQLITISVELQHSMQMLCNECIRANEEHMRAIKEHWRVDQVLSMLVWMLEGMQQMLLEPVGWECMA